MMKYFYPALIELERSRPGLLQRVLQQGKFNKAHTIVELPNDFDFCAAPTPPVVMRGLGDLVAKVAQPVARAVDAVAGTNLKNCGGCKDRQAKLNSLIPFPGQKPPV